VLPNFAAAPAYGWEIPPGGGLVDVESHVGGARYNLDAGTVMRWADAIPEGLDIDGVTVDVGGVTGGDDDPLLGVDRLNAVAIYESIGSPQISLDLYRSSVGQFPAAIMVWDSSSLGTPVGRGKQVYNERWNLLIVTERAESDPKRRGEGMRLLDAAQDLILWKQIYGDDFGKGGGFPVSAVHTQNVIGRFRVARPEKEWVQYYIYGLRLEAGRVASSVWQTSAKPWLKTRIKGHTVEANPPGDPNTLPLVDETVLMPQ